MDMRKLCIIILPALLIGCATVPPPIDNKIQEPAAEQVREASAPPINYNLSNAIDDIDSLTNPIEARPLDTPLDNTPNSPPVIVEQKSNNEYITAPKTVPTTLKNKITKTIIDAATSAIEGKSEKIIYDPNGDVKEKSVTIEKGSLVENITKLLALITATLGLYVGVKKFIHPTPETVEA